MRKLISVIVLVSVMLCLGACSVDIKTDESDRDSTGKTASVAEERRDIPLDSEEFKELQHEIFVANHLEELLKKHSSVIIDMTDAPENDNDWQDYYYTTDDVYYCECADYAEYNFDRYYYAMENTESEDGSNLYYGINLQDDPGLKELAGYQIPPEGQEELWSGSEDEEHVSCYIEDGVIYFMDRFKPEAGREWFEFYVPKETYDGQTVYSELIVDADTKEIKEFNHYLEDSDGTMTRIKSIKAFYDMPEPRRVRNMRAAFERYCENTIDVTVVVDPGTDREKSGSMTIPIGSQVRYRFDNFENAVIFDNAEATELTHWDGMRDKTIYLFTEPTEEQVEKYHELLDEIKKKRSGSN
ncbi:MAG: hypothetical protein J5829_04250 [Lachnospiraceae bacterium]|nr:hypothetical protein [Lachnospiraceae bacterium]